MHFDHAESTNFSKKLSKGNEVHFTIVFSAKSHSEISRKFVDVYLGAELWDYLNASPYQSKS